MTATTTSLQPVTRQEYDAIRALSNSGMKDLAVSPLRYWFHWINPAPKPEEDETETKALRIGSALHCAVLESPEVFDTRYARALDPSDWPVCLETISDIRGWITDHGGKPSGTRKDEVTAQALDLMNRLGVEVPILDEEKRRHFAANQGKTILAVEEWERVVGMTRALFDEPELMKILEQGQPEATLTATDPETGVLLKARLDWFAPGVTADLKTFTQKRGVSIDRSIHDAIFFEKYYIQAYFYRYVRQLVTGEKSRFVFGFVESEQPHETRLKEMRPTGLEGANVYWEQARVEVRKMIRLYADCLDKYGDAPWRDPQEVAEVEDGDIKQMAWG